MVLLKVCLFNQKNHLPFFVANFLVVSFDDTFLTKMATLVPEKLAVIPWLILQLRMPFGPFRVKGPESKTFCNLLLGWKRPRSSLSSFDQLAPEPSFGRGCLLFLGALCARLPQLTLRTMRILCALLWHPRQSRSRHFSMSPMTMSPLIGTVNGFAWLAGHLMRSGHLMDGSAIGVAPESFIGQISPLRLWHPLEHGSTSLMAPLFTSLRLSRGEDADEEFEQEDLRFQMMIHQMKNVQSLKHWPMIRWLSPHDLETYSPIMDNRNSDPFGPIHQYFIVRSKTYGMKALPALLRIGC